MALFRRSFAFSHSANRQRQQQPIEDIETGQVSTGEPCTDHERLPRNANLTSASSAPNALERESIQNAVDSVTPASPTGLQTCHSALSNGANSPAASLGAQHSSAGVLGRLMSVGSKGLKRSQSGTQPVCLICLENLTPEDFEVLRQLHQHENSCSSLRQYTACHGPLRFCKFSVTSTYALQSQCTVTTLVAFIVCLRIAPHLQQCVCPVMSMYK